MPVPPEQLEQGQSLAQKANEHFGKIDPALIRKIESMAPPFTPEQMEKFQDVARMAERHMPKWEPVRPAQIPRPLPPAPVTLAGPIRIEPPEPEPLKWHQHPYLDLAVKAVALLGFPIALASFLIERF